MLPTKTNDDKGAFLSSYWTTNTFYDVLQGYKVCTHKKATFIHFQLHFPNERSNMNFAFAFATLLPFLFSIPAVYAECDQCQFDGNDDASTCYDYGLIDNSVLIAWPLASQDCLDSYDIVISSPSGDPALVCASANSFVNELRLGSSLAQAKQGLGVDEGGFFNDDATGTLKDSITINGQTYDCEASSSDCYTAMKDYFGSDAAGQEEMQQVCDQLQNRVSNDKQLEQSTLRNRLCLETAESGAESIPNVCEPLYSELQTQMAAYPDKNCAGFAFGVQNMVIPGCEDVGTGNSGSSGSSTANGSSDSSTANGRSTLVQLGAVLSAIVLVSVL